MTRQILVIADGTTTGKDFRTPIANQDGGAARCTSRSRTHSTRLGTASRGLAARGIHAEGTIGDGEPLRAAIDALQLFPPDEVVLATRGSDRLVKQVAEHFDGPILEVVGAREHGFAAA